jgi:hypothetical protein
MATIIELSDRIKEYAHKRDLSILTSLNNPKTQKVRVTCKHGEGRTLDFDKIVDQYQCDCQSCSVERMDSIREWDKDQTQYFQDLLESQVLSNPVPEFDSTFKIRFNWRGYEYFKSDMKMKNLSLSKFIHLLDVKGLESFYFFREFRSVDHIIPLFYVRKFKSMKVISLAWNLKNMRYMDRTVNAVRGKSFYDEDLKLIANDDFLFALFQMFVAQRVMIKM